MAPAHHPLLHPFTSWSCVCSVARSFIACLACAQMEKYTSTVLTAMVYGIRERLFHHVLLFLFSYILQSSICG
jgi:hypothetical protein